AGTEQALGLQGHVGALLDDTYGEDALFAASGRGWWVGRPVEVPGSRPLQFEGGRSIGTRLTSWPRDHVVKCLVRFHPDDPAVLRAEQETQLRALYGAVQESGHELLLEVIPPTGLPCDDRTIARALDRIYEIGIYPEWWKLAPMSRESWKQVDDLVARRDPWCRGVLVLGLNAPIKDLAAGFRQAPLSATSGGFAIFGHGNVAGLGEALYRHRETLPTLRAHNEQGMAHAAIAFAKAHMRRRMMAATTSIGPGATNLVTAAATAHVNRLPVLFLPGDVFASRAPDPVLQQVEDFHDA